ncbi:MAG TPA: ferritin-like domain-containing protein [Anaerolineales bacterium]|nr:ferritin-like domain-containing protein [Anaerolineales bacterium]
MHDNQKDTLVIWLKDAYAMEQGIVEVLERQIRQFDDMPDAQQKVKQHVAMTKGHAERVRDCIERLDEDISRVKSGLANMLGFMQGMSTTMAKDKIVKNALANYAIEHFEIASYLSLATAAREIGYEDIAQVCEEIVVEEQEMANWLEQQIPIVTRQELLSIVYNE